MHDFKPLMTIGGKTLLEHCAAHFHIAGIEKVVVLTGHKANDVEAAALHLGLHCYRNQEYDQGMFSSVRMAVKSIAGELPSLDGLFILPVDIPLIRAATISRMIDCFDGKSVLLPLFQGEQGHPPLVPATLFPDILAHDGRGGLQQVLTRQHCEKIDVWDRGILLDADTPEDFQALERRQQRIGILEPVEAIELAWLQMPGKGIAHGIAVARIAQKIGGRLNEKGYSLNLDLLHNAGLLHDIGKGAPRHEVYGCTLLNEFGLHELAEITGAHRSLPPPENGMLTEKEVVCLADKLVKGSRPVNVQQRFDEKLRLYAHDPEAEDAISSRLKESLALLAMVEEQAGCTIDEIVAAGSDS
jgi:molybdenum cofactor cytidylyltransferase